MFEIMYGRMGEIGVKVFLWDWGRVGNIYKPWLQCGEWFGGVRMELKRTVRKLEVLLVS